MAKSSNATKPGRGVSGRRPFPKTVYVTWKPSSDGPFLNVAGEAQSLTQEVGAGLRAGVYELVGYVDVQNRSTVSPIERVIDRGDE
jgi:hypothetical protein